MVLYIQIQLRNDKKNNYYLKYGSKITKKKIVENQKKDNLSTSLYI